MISIKRFNENIQILTVIENIKEIFLTISDQFNLNLDWDTEWSYGKVDSYKVMITISTKEFINNEIYDKKKFTFDFFTIKSSYGDDFKKEITNHYIELIQLYEEIDTSISRLKSLYPQIQYNIDQRNTNKTELKIRIYIPNKTK